MIARLSVVCAVLHLTASALAAQAGQSTPPAVRWSGYIQAREAYQDEVGLTGSINRVRLSAAGSVAGDVSWRVQGEFRTGSAGRSASVSLQDAYIRWTRKALGVQVGQFKTRSPASSSPRWRKWRRRIARSTASFRRSSALGSRA